MKRRIKNKEYAIIFYHEKCFETLQNSGYKIGELRQFSRQVYDFTKNVRRHRHALVAEYRRDDRCNFSILS